jgi:immune inhibitor A
VTIRSPTVIALLAIALLVGQPATGHADERSAPQAMVDRLLTAPLPGREPLDLAVRLRGLSASTPLIAPIPAAGLVAGFTDTFWILDQRTAQLFQAPATLRLVTEHAYWFVETDLADRVLAADLQRSASVFETSTYPLIHRYFGSEPKPSVDRDGHIVFLLANVPGVAAYFSSADAYPRAINPRSNEHDMIYVNLNALRPGQQAFDSTITHEFQHMVHFARCPSQEGWVDEGASELAMRVAGYDGSAPLAFAAHPDVQLTTWSNQPAEVVRHYQAAYLFLRYVAERAGGWDALPRLFQTCARGEGLFSAFLSGDPIAPDVDTLFADWTVANLLQDASVGDGRYSYAGRGFHASVTGEATPQAAFGGSVPQYAANYVELPAGPGTATFNGDASVPLVAAASDSGGVWWSNRGDSLDARLTRRVDLGDASEATLNFRVWYDLEDKFDYVYLSASRDGGRTWQVLPGRHTSADHATGNNFGMGWTGSSGGDWIDEKVDLTPLVGSQILLRFEYVTDQSFNGQGFAFKDLRIPQIGLDEPGAVEGPWAAEGWVRVDGPIPERWNLRLVRRTPQGASVDPIEVDADGAATFALDENATRTTLVVAPTAPRTLLPGSYSVTISVPADKPAAGASASDAQ